MTGKRHLHKSKPPLEFPDVFNEFRRLDKLKLNRDVNFPYHQVKKGEHALIIGFVTPDNRAIVTVHCYREARDVPIAALHKKKGDFKWESPNGSQHFARTSVFRM